jgi:hypothetical protein
MQMHPRLLSAIAILLAAGTAEAQQIVEVPASNANVARPDDLFNLEPGRWHMARLISQGSEPCQADQCEAGFTTADLVVSVEHAKDFVRIIAGFRGCEQTAYSEVEVGTKPGKPTFARVAKQVERVVEGLGKTCKLPVPPLPKLEVAAMFGKGIG